MLIYCKHCQNLVKRVDEAMYRENEMLQEKCDRCGRTLTVVIRYRPKCIDSVQNRDKLIENQVI